MLTLREPHKRQQYVTIVVARAAADNPTPLAHCQWLISKCEQSGNSGLSPATLHSPASDLWLVGAGNEMIFRLRHARMYLRQRNRKFSAFSFS